MVATHGDGAASGWIKNLLKEVLIATFWLDADQRIVYSASIRFYGRRLGVSGRPEPGDRFIKDEFVEGILPGAGPISITTSVTDINPGEWIVTAELLNPKHNPRGTRGRAGSAALKPSGWAPLPWLWRRWAPSVEASRAVKFRTCLAPLGRLPGIIPFLWALMVALGMVAALGVLAAVIAREDLEILPAIAAALLAIGSGTVGAKLWFILLHRRERKWDGWCIQGFLAGVILIAPAVVLVAHMPVGTFLNAATPGLFFGMALGRIGCFFAGCCGGRPTASRWAVWSSDRRVGARRIPTQLLESSLCLILGVTAVVTILNYRALLGGCLFVAALATYTLVRQALLRARAEPRKSALGAPLTAGAAALALIVLAIPCT